MSDSLQPYGLLPARLSVHGILQARILEWVAVFYPRGSSHPGIEPMSFISSPLTDCSLPRVPLGKPFIGYASYQLYPIVTQMLYMHFRQ